MDGFTLDHGKTAANVNNCYSTQLTSTRTEAQRALPPGKANRISLP